MAFQSVRTANRRGFLPFSQCDLETKSCCPWRPGGLSRRLLVYFLLPAHDESGTKSRLRKRVSRRPEDIKLVAGESTGRSPGSSGSRTRRFCPDTSDGKLDHTLGQNAFWKLELELWPSSRLGDTRQGNKSTTAKNLVEMSLRGHPSWLTRVTASTAAPTLVERQTLKHQVLKASNPQSNKSSSGSRHNTRPATIRPIAAPSLSARQIYICKEERGTAGRPLQTPPPSTRTTHHPPLPPSR